MYITPEITRNQQYAKEYLEHVALIRELLDQSSLSTNYVLLSLSNNRLFQSLSGLLTRTSDCTLTREPIPVWNLVRVLRMSASADLLRQTTMLMDGKDEISINTPCAPSLLGSILGIYLASSLPNNEPQLEHWTVSKHGGLKEFIDQVISAVGRVQIKPATECLRGAATYASGDHRQGRYKMTLTDLMNHHCARAVRKGMMDLILGRSDHIVKIGDM